MLNIMLGIVLYMHKTRLDTREKKYECMSLLTLKFDFWRQALQFLLFFCGLRLYKYNVPHAYENFIFFHFELGFRFSRVFAFYVNCIKFTVILTPGLGIM